MTISFSSQVVDFRDKGRGKVVVYLAVCKLHPEWGNFPCRSIYWNENLAALRRDVLVSRLVHLESNGEAPLDHGHATAVQRVAGDDVVQTAAQIALQALELDARREAETVLGQVRFGRALHDHLPAGFAVFVTPQVGVEDVDDIAAECDRKAAGFDVAVDVVAVERPHPDAGDDALEVLRALHRLQQHVAAAGDHRLVDVLEAVGTRREHDVQAQRPSVERSQWRLPEDLDFVGADLELVGDDHPPLLFQRRQCTLRQTVVELPLDLRDDPRHVTPPWSYNT